MKVKHRYDDMFQALRIPVAHSRAECLLVSLVSGVMWDLLVGAHRTPGPTLESPL